VNKFKERIYYIFSDGVMVALALLIIPVILAQTLLELSPAQQILVSVIDWGIWIAFFLEFFLKLTAEEKKLKWLRDNWFDSLVSIIIIISPILENAETIFSVVPGLRLLRLGRIARLSRLLRFLRLFVLGGKIKHTWKRINLKIYVVFFFVLGIGFAASFIATGFEYSSTDTTWISLFVSVFGVFYSVLISFFVVHIWGKFNDIGGEIGKQVNSLRNVYILTRQLPHAAELSKFPSMLVEYVNCVIDTLWTKKTAHQSINDKFMRLVNFFDDIRVSSKTDEIVINNIFEELRISSGSQTNLINLSQDKTPKILWILLLLLSIVLVGSFIFLGFQNQLLATTLITLVSVVTGLVVTLIFDIDTPFQAGFWNISSQPYLDLKEFVEK